jgi:hypothetical protein
MVHMEELMYRELKLEDHPNGRKKRRKARINNATKDDIPTVLQEKSFHMD